MTLREAFFWSLLAACALMFFITGCMDRHFYKPAHVPLEIDATGAK